VASVDPTAARAGSLPGQQSNGWDGAGSGSTANAPILGFTGSLNIGLVWSPNAFEYKGARRGSKADNGAA
jgi:hypothetical protein